MIVIRNGVTIKWDYTKSSYVEISDGEENSYFHILQTTGCRLLNQFLSEPEGITIEERVDVVDILSACLLGGSRDIDLKSNVEDHMLIREHLDAIREHIEEQQKIIGESFKGCKEAYDFMMGFNTSKTEQIRKMLKAIIEKAEEKQ